jgi:hypothetical protein
MRLFRQDHTGDRESVLDREGSETSLVGVFVLGTFGVSMTTQRLPSPYGSTVSRAVDCVVLRMGVVATTAVSR